MAMQQSTVEDFVKTSLNNRIAAAKDPDSNLAWTTGKMPWMRFTSRVTGATSNKYKVLEGKSTISTLGSIYDTSTSGRNLPQPGLISATVKHTGTLKTLKNVEVKYKCWSLGQLKQLEQLFMSLGKTVVLEYGWSIKPNGRPVTTRMGSSSLDLPFGAFVKKSRKYAESAQGCYDAVKGVVSNFKWSQDIDGGFSCSTTLTSPAEMMMSTPAKNVDSPCCCKVVDQTEEEMEEECKAGTAISRKLQEILKSEVIPVGKSLTRNGKKVGFSMKIDKEQTDAEKEDRSFTDKWIKGWFTDSMMTPVKYITWAYFENAFLNDGTLPVTSQAEASSDYTDTTPQAPAGYDVKTRKQPWRFDTTRTKVANPQYMTSADPTVCMLPGQEFWKLKDNANPSTGDFTHMGGLEEMSKFNAGGKLGWLSSVCINVRFLMTVALESETLSDMANSVLDGINAACGNKWDLVITPLDDNPSVMSVVDTSALGAKVTPYRLSIFGNHSIAKETEIDTQVSDSIKAQIMYGSNSSDSDQDFSLFGEGLGDSTTGWGDFKNESKECCVDANAEEKNEEDPETKMLESYEEAWEDLLDGADPDTIQGMKSAVKALQEFSATPAAVKPAHPPVLPINFKFTTDGINGFKWGNSISVKNLPKRYSGATFMVTAIDHSISAATWDTSIETILRIPPPE